ncbi:MAG: RHS repeat-associated core domain-containing protein, partial [Leptospiraceae bacterium]|nr:RHS repeat-associated core domain-containing protein [Leptospiraceae bacterium]
EDPETGLYYYKSRYYDPAIGRFIQPDTVINPESTFGMNLYMYVEGNPVMYTDPTGHWKLSHITKGKWARNISRPINRFIFGRHHNAKALTHGNAFIKSAGRGAQFALAVMNPGLSLLVQPMFTAGFYYSSGMFIQSAATNGLRGKKMPYITYHNGGYGMENMNLPHRASVWGPFAMLPNGITQATRLHEYGHLDQYRDWGDHKYFAAHAKRPFEDVMYPSKSNYWAENNADYRSMSANYNHVRNYYMYKSFIDYSNSKGKTIEPALLYLFFNYLYGEL